MKKLLLIVSLVASLPQLITAQTKADEWLPMLTEGRTWQGMDLKIPGGNEYSNVLGRTYSLGAPVEFLVDGKEEYMGQSYMRLVEKGGLLNTTNTTLLRQDGARIIAATGDGTESVIYDFSLNKGDIFVIDEASEMNLRVVKAADIIIEGTQRRCLWMQTYYADPDVIPAYDVEDIWVEGLGSIVYGPSNGYLDLWITGSGSCVNLCEQDNQVLFSSDDSQKFTEIVTGVATIGIHRNTLSILYDLQGRRLDCEPQHGVFIRDGRKVVK